MAKFITNNGSYTLVLKPDGAKPIYDHKGVPVRVDGTIYAEFKNIRGTPVGVLETDDPKMLAALRANNQYGISFKEVKEEEFKAATAQPSAKPIMLPKSALMACNKTELTSLASQYNVAMDDSMTKAEIVDLILKSGGVEQKKLEPQQIDMAGGIRKIIQNAPSA